MIKAPQPQQEHDEPELESADTTSEPMEPVCKTRSLTKSCSDDELTLPNWQSPSARPMRLLATSKQNTPAHLLNGSEVLLHVYDLHQVVRLMGFGIFHLGIEVYACELYFGAQGVQWCQPGSVNGHVHKQVLKVGHIKQSAWEVHAMVEQMRKTWSGETYSVFSRNCQTFAVEFCRNSGLGNCIPPEFVRYSNWSVSIFGLSGIESARIVSR